MKRPAATRILGTLLLFVLLAASINSAMFTWKFLTVRPSAQGFVPGAWTESADSAVLDLGAGVSIEFARTPDRLTRSGSLWVARHEITVAQYSAFAAASGYLTVAEREGFAWVPRNGGFDRAAVSWRTIARDGPPGTAVGFVTWVDAKAFTVWASARAGRSIRMLRVAEWEALCRAGSPEAGPADLRQRAWFRSNATSTHEVGLLKPDRLGLYDLLGNVWEWNDDQPQWWVVRERPLSGGSWMNGASMLRCDNRVAEDVRIREPHIGFRVVGESAAGRP